MSALVLAFSQPKKQQRNTRSVSKRAEVERHVVSLRKLIELELVAGAEDVAKIHDLMDVLIAEARQRRLAGNIGKPVIYIDTDDREGA